MAKTRMIRKKMTIADIEKKYGNKVKKCFNKWKDSTDKEGFFKELEEIKKVMADEMSVNGLLDED